MSRNSKKICPECKCEYNVEEDSECESLHSDENTLVHCRCVSSIESNDNKDENIHFQVKNDWLEFMKNNKIECVSVTKREPLLSESSKESTFIVNDRCGVKKLYASIKDHKSSKVPHDESLNSIEQSEKYYTKSGLGKSTFLTVKDLPNESELNIKEQSEKAVIKVLNESTHSFLINNNLRKENEINSMCLVNSRFVAPSTKTRSNTDSSNSNSSHSKIGSGTSEVLYRTTNVCLIPRMTKSNVEVVEFSNSLQRCVMDYIKALTDISNNINCLRGTLVCDIENDESCQPVSSTKEQLAVIIDVANQALQLINDRLKLSDTEQQDSNFQLKTSVDDAIQAIEVSKYLLQNDNDDDQLNLCLENVVNKIKLCIDQLTNSFGAVDESTSSTELSKTASNLTYSSFTESRDEEEVKVQTFDSQVSNIIEKKAEDIDRAPDKSDIKEDVIDSAPDKSDIKEEGIDNYPKYSERIEIIFDPPSEILDTSISNKEIHFKIPPTARRKTKTAMEKFREANIISMEELIRPAYSTTSNQFKYNSMSESSDDEIFIKHHKQQPPSDSPFQKSIKPKKNKEKDKKRWGLGIMKLFKWNK